MTVLLELIILIGALIVHELTHFIHFYLLGFKPKFGFIGVGPCVEPTVENIPVRFMILNIFLAVTAGFVFLNIMHATSIMIFAYTVGCFMDLNNAQLLLVYVWRKTITLDTNINSIKVVIDKCQNA